MADSKQMVQTQAALSTQGAALSDLTLTPADRAILRRLAGEVAELAARPIEAEKRELWYRHNALQPTRPLVFCDPENGWNEIITPDRAAVRGRAGARLGDAPAQGDLLGRARCATTA